MEWSKEKTLKLIELLQVNASLWNPSVCDTRRDKQKRKEELKSISDMLGISVPDVTKKIQHLRTQYNREAAREIRAKIDHSETYVSNWYAFEYLHFLKDPSKPYQLLQSNGGSSNGHQTHSDATVECKLPNLPTHPQTTQTMRTGPVNTFKPDIKYTSSSQSRDEFTVFGEYIANELRSLKGERNLIVAKKRIQDIIFDVKIGIINETKTENNDEFQIYENSAQNTSTMNSTKMYTSEPSITAEPLPQANPPTSSISEIIINNACNYSASNTSTRTLAVSSTSQWCGNG